MFIILNPSSVSFLYSSLFRKFLVGSIGECSEQFLFLYKSKIYFALGYLSLIIFVLSLNKSIIKLDVNS